MTELPPERQTDDERIKAAVDRYRESGMRGVLDDTTARMIASQWHGGQDTPLYSFTSTGAIDLDELQGELLGVLIMATIEEDEQKQNEIEALTLYLLETGERGPVEGWHDATKWGSE